MTTRSAITLAVVLATSGLTASGMIAGCGYGTPAAVSGRAAAAGNVLRCGSVVDSTGYKRGPLTTNLAVAFLTRLRLSSGAADIPRGRPTSADTNTLDTMAVELMGYSGSRLSDDAEAFAVAELNYNPGGPVDTSYAQRLDEDILALQRDCPGGMRLGAQWRRAR
jgi:hypothetical protein